MPHSLSHYRILTVALGALAQGTRLDAFRLLVRHEPDGLPAGEIAQLDADDLAGRAAISPRGDIPGCAIRRMSGTFAANQRN